MCIIVYKPKGKKLPDIDILETCYENNPDGAGLMYKRKEFININKGFMTWKDFLNVYRSYNFTKDDTFALHFRIATHGNIDKKTCHPFPVSDKISDLQSYKFKTEFAIMHNGIISLEDESDELSDSQLFVKDILSGIKPKEIYNNKYIQNLIELASKGSKLFLWHIDYGIIITGGWKLDNDIYYSNDSYKPYINLSKWSKITKTFKKEYECDDVLDCYDYMNKI